MTNTSYSYSQLQAAYRCQTYYKLLYVDKLIPTVPKNADLMFGSAVHFALEQYLTSSADIKEAFHIYWDRECEKLSYGRFKQGELETQADILLTRFVNLHAKKIKVKQLEQRLYGTLHGDSNSLIKVEGTPDLIGEYSGKLSIIDFKTAGYRYPNEKIFLNEQMYLYSHLARQNKFDIEQIVYIIFIKGSVPSIQTLVRPLDIVELDKVLVNIKAQCLQLDNLHKTNQWSYNSNSCKMGARQCDFFEQCWKGYKNEPNEN